MQPLTSQGQERINQIASQYGVSSDAVLTLLQALVNGNGTMAQFNHWELGGGGQWMQGGMTMVGDMFNSSLKAKVDGLCFELSNLLAQQPFKPMPISSQSQNQNNGQQPGGQQQSQGGYGNYGSSSNGPVSLFIPGSSGNWWPNDLGSPSSSGAQNNVRYAYFPSTHRLAVDINGQVSVYDTLDHQIGGVSQQQGYGASVIFTSQYGTVDVLNLPLISGAGTLPKVAPVVPPVENLQSAPMPLVNIEQTAQEVDIFAKIEKLADLKQKGILSESEFSEKKAELLSRL
ncbi:MAG: SHOCT domain-containing protein [Thiotrichaceae bacterium]|nr:SHOCT domain-containing protein [Thiotrichaceae bacterium]